MILGLYFGTTVLAGTVWFLITLRGQADSHLLSVVDLLQVWAMALFVATVLPVAAVLALPELILLGLFISVTRIKDRLARS